MTDSCSKETTLIFRIQVVALVLALLPGCSAIATYQDPDHDQRVYSGTAVNLGLMGTPFFIFGIVDLPFSLIADTLLLPITIPEQIAIYRNIGIIAAGAEGDMKKVRDMLEERPELAHESYRRHSFLCYAAATGRADFVALLLEYGADPN